MVPPEPHAAKPPFFCDQDVYICAFETMGAGSSVPEDFTDAELTALSAALERGAQRGVQVWHPSAAVEKESCQR